MKPKRKSHFRFDSQSVFSLLGFNLLLIGFVLSFVSCTKYVEEVEITTVSLERVDPPPFVNLAVGETVIFRGGYSYVGDDHDCGYEWQIKDPSGDFTRYRSGECYAGVPSDASFPGDVITLPGDNCRSQLTFIPGQAGEYEIELTIKVCDYGDDYNRIKTNSMVLVVSEEEPDESCSQYEDCGTDSFYVLNEGCIPESDAIKSDNLLINPGFETDAFGDLFPATAGGWSGDIVSQVSSEGGIDPAEGNHMLRFDYTSYISAGSGGASELAQVYLLPEDLKTRVNGGESITIRQEAFFNRVDLDENTDSQFLMILMAFDGPTEEFPDKFLDRDNQALAVASVSVISDSCINTWEKGTTEIVIPAGTEYIGVVIAALENIENDSTGTEFDGHYADAVSLYLVE